ACSRGLALGLDHEGDVVDEAPAPGLARLGGACDRVAVVACVARGVPVRRGVAAADRPAGRAHAQVHPGVAGLEALLAARDRLRELREVDLVEMAADLGGHTTQPPVCPKRSVLTRRGSRPRGTSAPATAPTKPVGPQA